MVRAEEQLALTTPAPESSIVIPIVVTFEWAIYNMMIFVNKYTYNFDNEPPAVVAQTNY